MPFFVIFSLSFSALAFLDSPYLSWLLNEQVIDYGALVCGVFWLGGVSRKLSTSTWHDGFACATLPVWYAYWQPQFAEQAPMFRFFPLYFAVLAGWLTLIFVSRTLRFDADSREALRQLQRLTRFDSRVIAVLVLTSLAFPEHYLTYPLLVTLFLVRFTMERCLELIDA